MIIFDKNEFEIAIVTYNRAKFVEEWISQCYSNLLSRNIALSIYDSSSNEETEELIRSLNKVNQRHIHYVKVDSAIAIGYKPMLPIFRCTSKYVWVSGDSRMHDFEELDAKVFPYIKKGIDYILLNAITNNENDGKVYTEKSEFLRECLISTTCIGLSIYKRSIFNELFSNVQWLEECDMAFKSNYGFGWLGYFYSVFANNEYKAVFSVVKTINILPGKKKQAWASRFYECWVENLCDLIDRIPEIYKNKDLVIRETWTRMNLESHFYCYRARVCGGLDSTVFNKYLNNGMLARVTKKLNRIRIYAMAPIWTVKILYFFHRAYGKAGELAEKFNGNINK